MSELDDTLQRRRVLAALACVLLIVALVWLRSLWGEFVYDDNLLIRRNPHLASFAQLPQILGRGMWSFLDAGDAEHLGYWRPLAGLALLATNVLGNGSPLVFHAVVIALHLAATAAAFVLAREVAGDAVLALAVALLFGLHPVHVESVAWISALNDPLFAIFSCLALASWMRWRRTGSPGSPWGAGLLLLLALLAKELALAVLPILVSFDLLRERRADEPAGTWGGVTSAGARAWLPFALAVAAWYLGRVLVFGELGAGFGRTTTYFGVDAARLAQLRLELLGGYVWLAAWPVELNLFHPFKPVLSGSDPQFLRALASAALLTVALVWAWRRKLRVPAFALGFLPLSILPALVRVESLGVSPLAERYLYLGVFGFVLALCWALWRLLPQALAIVLTLAIAAGYALRSVERIGFWHDEERMFRTLLVDSPDVPQGYWGLARVLLERYRAQGAIEDLREAMDVTFRGLDLLGRAQRGDGSVFATKNDHVQTNLALAWCLLFSAQSNGDLEAGDACKAFEEIARSYPQSEQAQVGLAAAAQLANRLPEAEQALRTALAMNDRNADAHHNLGVVLMLRGDLAAAASSFERALELRPSFLEDQIFLARIALQRGDEPHARQWLERARKAHPESTAPLVVEATLAAQKRDFDTALELVTRALERNPDEAEGLLLKAKLHAAQGEKNSARLALARACELLPTSFEANYNMGALLLESSPAEALPYLVRAYELRPPDQTGALLRQRMLALNLRSAKTACDLAGADIGRNDLEGAREWAAKAAALEPENGAVHKLAGELALRAGQLEQAEREFRRACELLPEDLDARLTLARHLKQYGRPEQAGAVLREMLELVQRKGVGTIEEQLTRRSALEMLGELGAK